MLFGSLGETQVHWGLWDALACPHHRSGRGRARLRRGDGPSGRMKTEAATSEASPWEASPRKALYRAMTD
jgi:hypothetical protein